MQMSNTCKHRQQTETGSSSTRAALHHLCCAVVQPGVEKSLPGSIRKPSCSVKLRWMCCGEMEEQEQGDSVGSEDVREVSAAGNTWWSDALSSTVCEHSYTPTTLPDSNTTAPN
eukprot:3377496-Rhodomonas_salina.1